MLEDYDVTKGQLWPLIIAFERVGPAAIRVARLQRER